MSQRIPLLLMPVPLQVGDSVYVRMRREMKQK